MRTTLLVLGLLFPVSALADPVAIASDGNSTVMLYDEPCALPVVSNLPKRATWKDNAGAHEGCWGASQGLVLMYFADKSVVAAAASSFQRVNAI